MQKLRGGSLIAVLAMGIWFSFSDSSLAQVYSGSITGTVTDATGGVIPNASVTLTDENKGFTFKASSGSDGRYILRNLSPGLYKLTVSAAGMRNYERPGLDLEVGQNAQADVRLDVGGAAQAVEVVGSAPLLQTQDASTGQTINQKFINDLPLVGRSVFNLAQMSPGVTQAAGGTFGLNANPVNFISNGGRNSTADILMDGASQTGIENNGGISTALYTPPLDAVQEFTVQQNTYAADVGFGGNTVLNVITKSGTNEFHGSLYEFLQNNVLNANNFFNNQNGVKISPNKNNQFGGTIGGPIHKDKTFFFGDYQGTFTRSTGTARAGVPSALERTGDFGELCTHAGGAFDAAGRCSAASGQLWDPTTGVFSSAVNGPVRSNYIPFDNLTTYMSPGTNLIGTPYQLPVKPGNLIDPVAMKMMQYYPMPNVAVGTAQYNPLNNWIGTNGNLSNDHRFDVKVDHLFSDVSRITLRSSLDHSHSEGVNCFGNVADPCTQGPINGYQSSTAISYNHSFSPTWLMNFSYGYTRKYSYTAGVAADFSSFNPVTTLGLPSYILTSGYIATPNITVGNGYQSVSGQALGSQTFSILSYPLDTHDLNVSMDKTSGKHEFKFGYEVRMHRVSFLQVSYPEGQWNFQATGTSQTPASGTGGDPLASLLMGFPESGGGSNTYQVDVAVTTQNYEHAWYFQDNWRPTSKLTLNVGLRYELVQPRTETLNRQSYIDPNVASPLQVAGLPPLKGGLDFTNSNNRSPYNIDPMNFGPRIGLAYHTAGDIIIRTGYGIFFDPSKADAQGTGGGGFQGYNFATPFVLTYQNDGATPSSRMSNPYPGTGPQLPPGSTQGLLTGLGLGVSGPIQTWNSTPYIQTWNFGLQKQVKGLLLEANYVGTRGTHLYFGGAGTLNFLGPWVETASAAQITALNSNVPNPFYGVITNPASSLSAPTVQLNQLDKPYPQFTGFSGNDPPWASSSYHALQLRVEKRFANGLQILGTYVFSKSIDNSSETCGCTTWLGGTTSLQDPNNRALERSVSQFDIPQVFQFSYVYALPFGKGKKFGGSWNGFVDAILGGWQTNGLWRFDDGLPLSISLANSRPLPTYGTQRPNLIGPLTRNNNSNWLSQYFANPANAVIPAAFTVGNAPRTIPTVRAPGTATAALSLFKQFKLDFIREGSFLEFRAEAFNALNHPQFAPPNTTVGSSAFGQVTSQANSPRTMQLAMKMYF
jgi:hypothetical protein